MPDLTRDLFIKHHKSEGSIILEVTVDRLYIVPKHQSCSLEDIKKEWFCEFENRSHVFKDNCYVSFSDKVVNIKEL